MNWSGKISEEALGKIRTAFLSLPKNRRHADEILTLQRNGKFIEALKKREAFDKSFDEFVEKYLKEIRRTYEHVELKKLGIAGEELLTMYTYLLTIYMSLDIIDTAVRDIDEILQKKDNTLKFEMFKNFQSLRKMNDDALRVIRESEYVQDLAWGDSCDELYSMMVNKAKKLLKKKGEASWGKNFSKLNKT